MPCAQHQRAGRPALLWTAPRTPGEPGQNWTAGERRARRFVGSGVRRARRTRRPPWCGTAPGPPESPPLGRAVFCRAAQILVKTAREKERPIAAPGSGHRAAAGAVDPGPDIDPARISAVARLGSRRRYGPDLRRAGPEPWKGRVEVRKVARSGALRRRSCGTRKSYGSIGRARPSPALCAGDHRSCAAKQSRTGRGGAHLLTLVYHQSVCRVR